MEIYSENVQKLTLVVPSLMVMCGQFRLTTIGSDDVNLQIFSYQRNKIELRLEHYLTIKMEVWYLILLSPYLSIRTLRQWKF